MDDIVVYLIFLAFALLSRFLTKKKEKSSPPPRPKQREGQGQSERPKSFEELLREFTDPGSEPAHQQQKTKPVQEAEYEEEYTSYEDDIYDEEKYDEMINRDEEAKEVYEKSIKRAKELKTIDELVDYDKVKTKLDIDKFDPYSKTKKRTIADDIRQDLQNTDEVRKAVIYSEILKRKYF